MKIDLIDAVETATMCVSHDHIPLFVGPSGIGKTALFKKMAERKGHDFRTYDCSYADFADWGLYTKMEDGVRAVIPEHMQWLFNTDRPTIVLVDELPLAPEIIQGNFMAMFNQRMVRNQRISDNLLFVSAGNRSEDMVGGNPLKWPLVSRMAVYPVFCGDRYFKEWGRYMDGRADPTHIAALLRSPDMLLNAKPSTSGLKEGGDPRSWDKALHTIYKLKLPMHQAKRVLLTHVGEENATKFEGIFELPDLESSIANPESVVLPENRPDLLAAFGSAIAASATKDNLQGVLDLTRKFPKEFQSRIVKDIGIQHEELKGEGLYMQIAMTLIG